MPLIRVSCRNLVKGRIVKVDVPLIHLLLAQPQTLAEPLEVNHLTFPQEADHVIHVGVVGQAQDVVIGLPGFLLGGQVFGQVGDDVAGGLDGGGSPGEARGGGGVDGGSMIHEIGGKIGIGPDVLVLQIAGQLVYDGGHHFQVAQFFGTCRGGAMEERVQNPCAARPFGVNSIPFRRGRFQFFFGKVSDSGTVRR